MSELSKPSKSDSKAKKDYYGSKKLVRFLDEISQVMKSNELDSVEVANPFGSGVIKVIKTRHNSNSIVTAPTKTKTDSFEEDDELLFWSAKQ